MIAELKLATRTLPGLRPRRFGLLATIEARRAWRFPSHVVVVKNWQRSSKNSTRKWSPRKVPVVNTARAPTLAHKRLRNDICECRSDLSTFLPPTSWDSQRRVERPQEGRFGKQVKYTNPISEGDLAKISEYFDNVLEEPTTVKLTEHCWFVITSHQCLRACEVQKALRRDNLIFEMSSNGDMLVRRGADFMSKNCPSGINGREFSSCGRITARRKVSALRLLLQNLHPSVDGLLQRAHPPSNLLTRYGSWNVRWGTTSLLRCCHEFPKSPTALRNRRPRDVSLLDNFELFSSFLFPYSKLFSQPYRCFPLLFRLFSNVLLCAELGPCGCEDGFLKGLITCRVINYLGLTSW